MKILVIGAGAAGMSAALSAKETNPDLDVIVVSKGLQGKAHTCEAEGGINAALYSPDNWRKHYEDTLKGGSYRNNPYLVEILCKEAPKAIEWLRTLGLHFDLNEKGEIAQRPIGGHSLPRCCYSADRIGAEILLTLTEEARRQNIIIKDDILITRLLTEKGRVVGAFGIDKRTGEYITFNSDATILATGGIGQIYQFTSNAKENTGDGLILAKMIGCELVDLEFIQFHPTGIAVGRKPGALISEANRGIGGKLLSFDGKEYKRFVNELEKRSVVALAIWEELEKGNQVFLDLTHLDPEFIQEQVPDTLKQIKELANLDLREDLIPVTPTAHFHMGGIKVDEKTLSAMPGLFACGEVMAGVHGANRLGGNSLLETIIFGNLSGKKSVEYLSLCQKKKSQEREKNSLKIKSLEIERLEKIKQIQNPLQIQQKMKSIMWKRVGLKRTIQGLNQGYFEILNCQFEIGSDFSLPRWYNSIELFNQLALSILIINSASRNLNSQGAHQICIE